MQRTIALMLLLGSLIAGYTDRSFEVYAVIDENGNAHVSEKTVFSLDSKFEIDAFDYLRSESKTLSDYTKFSKNIHYHFNSIDSNSLSVIPTKELSRGYNMASVTVEYNAGGVFEATKKTTRITSYSLDTSQLAFSSSGKTGEIALDKNSRFSLELPTDAINLKIVPGAGVSKDNRVLTWNGPISGSWSISFEREKPLSTEVSEFFTETFEQIYSSGVMFLLLLFLLLSIVFKLIKSRK